MADNQKPGAIDTDAALTSDDPQAQVSGQGWGKILDGGERTGQQFQDPRQQEIGLQQPSIDPIDVAGGAIAGGIGSRVTDAIANGLSHTEFRNIVGNEIGSVGKSVKMVPKGTFKNKFDVDAYHGTRADIEEFNPDALGASTGANSARKAYFFAEDPSTASDYANLSNSRNDLRSAAGDERAIDVPSGLSQLHLEEELKTLQRNSPEVTQKYIDQMKQGQQSLQDKLDGKIPRGYQPVDYIKSKLQEYPDKIREAEQSLSKESLKAREDRISELQNNLNKYKQVDSESSYGQNVLPVKLRMENPYVHDFKGKPYRDEPYSAIIDKAKEAGHDSVHFKNTYDPADPENRVKQSIYAVFEPHQVRSKFAEFDPKKAKSGKLSYADGGAVAPVVPTNVLSPQAPQAPEDQDVHVLDQDGEMWKLPNHAVPQALKEGYTIPQPEQVAQYEQEKKYGSTGQQIKGAAEGLAQGVAGPLAPMAERALGVNPEDIRGRAETNPVGHYTGEIAGLLAPGSLVGKGLGAVGKAADLVTGGAKAATLAGRIGSGAAKAAIENMTLAGSDEASKMILQDPSQSAQTAMVDVGLSGVLGGALGGTMSAVSPLWKASVGNKLAQTIEDFKGRVQEHINNPNPVDATTEELKNYYGNIKGMADEVYGPQGLKAQDVAKALPSSITPEITEQNQQVFNAVKGTVDDMVGNESLYPKRLVSKLQGDLESFAKRVSSDDVTERFNATQDLKQQLQSYAKFDKFVKPVDEAYDFVAKAKNLSHDLRQKLEDPNVWGKAAERQQSINKAFQQYLPALKDFEKRFTTKILGESEIDPAKIQTYLSQAGKPNAEIKQEMLKNFLDASAKYQKVLHDTHLNLGMESPVVNSSLASTMATLGKKTTGAKLADMFIEKGLTDAGGKSIGAGIGGGLGHAMGGHGEIGALLGAHTLGPFFSSVLPAIVKPIIEKIGSSSGMKAAVDYGVAVAKGEGLMTRASKNVLRLGSQVLADSQMPTERARNKLDKILKGLQVDPSPMLTQENHTDHYLPDHATAMSQVSMNAVNYLNSLRPNESKKSPLDSKPVVSPAQKAKYDNALNIAEQPLVVLHKIQQGQLNSDDIKTLSTVYPALYDRLRSKMMEQIVDVEHKDKIIPYKTRTSLSLFMGTPLDSTMTPASIMSMQAQSQSGKQAAQQPAPAGPKRSTSSLSKLPASYSTPDQTAAARRSRP